MRVGFVTFLRTGAFALGLQVLLAGTAAAHDVRIEASSFCGPAGAAVITFTASTGRPTIDQHNNIVITINNVFVMSGAFVAPTGSFTNTVLAPSGTTASVTATAVGDWVPNPNEVPNPFPGGQTASTTVTIPQDCTTSEGVGRFTGGGRQVEVGGVAKVTRGLTIHCDLLLSNNLEINWTGGNNFHMNEHLTTLECSDSPLIDQNPPNAPLDTLRGVGIGKFNNQPGYTVQFTLVDAGEPGRDDMMAIRIFETANPSNVVLDIPLAILDDGNLQAHFDQPHKNKP